ncbi:MAG: sigma-54-dependent Fis family transcriptional regulator [Elusimicrobia bacterium]|nr:sigma-54-dependent Fis family transcriptional regulator [Elusimicrobiota bacterium]
MAPDLPSFSVYIWLKMILPSRFFAGSLSSLLTVLLLIPSPQTFAANAVSVPVVQRVGFWSMPLFISPATLVGKWLPVLKEYSAWTQTPEGIRMLGARNRWGSLNSFLSSLEPEESTPLFSPWIQVVRDLKNHERLFGRLTHMNDLSEQQKREVATTMDMVSARAAEKILGTLEEWIKKPFLVEQEDSSVLPSRIDELNLIGQQISRLSALYLYGGEDTFRQYQDALSSEKQAILQGASQSEVEKLTGQPAKNLGRETRAVLERPLGSKERKQEYPFGNIVYASSQMERVLDLVKRVASKDVPVLIQGETGTGKELVARAIHAQSGRKGFFVPVNPATLPETLVESELFGHRKGSFTGAGGDRKGLIEEANGGTLFLDEISEAPPSIQVKLLRVIQEREIRPVGQNVPIPVSGRLVTATNKDLLDLIKQGKFREDLYYRLGVWVIHLAPLRERREDILPLAQHFLERAVENNLGSARSFSEEAAMILLSYLWPGNVRELENVVTSAVLMAVDQSEVRPQDLRIGVLSDPASSFLSLAEAERRHILEIYELTGRKNRKTAKILGINPSTLYRKLLEYGVLHKSDPGDQEEPGSS